MIAFNKGKGRLQYLMKSYIFCNLLSVLTTVLPCWHVYPLHPFEHVQMYDPKVLVHMPLPTQGSRTHSLVSVFKVQKERR